MAGIEVATGELVKATKAAGLPSNSNALLVCKYYAWLSSKGEKRELLDGAVFAGMVRDVPKALRVMLDPSEKRQYCVIREAH